LTITDDGRGIDMKKLSESAIREGYINRESTETLSEEELLNFIFRSGTSTSQFITDLSGRGLGMAIAAEKVSNLQGTIRVTTGQSKGTTFTIILPTSIATFRGILVSAGGEYLLIPTIFVEKAIRVKKKEIRTVEGRQTINIDGKSFALAFIADLFRLDSKRGAKGSIEKVRALILESARSHIAFAVDEILGEYEGIIKPLGNQINYVNCISGATILGDGRIIPVVNVPELMEMAIASSATQQASPLSDEEPVSSDEARKVLIAEDSITARSLLRNIVESAGYQVTTAVDGAEALSKLKGSAFDILVSDIEMPRMSGIELTSRIREDKELSELPVILVTALESNQDRQRGMEAGANAYIVKSNFEQSNLLDTIHRLI